VLVGVLSIAAGFRRAMTASATPDAALVLRSGADSEMVSGLRREDVRLIADAPGVARNAKGPLISAELFVIINLPKRSTGTDANVPLRGVEPAAAEVREQVKLVAGRMFEPGRNEVVVGIGASREFAGLEVGSQLKVGRDSWPIVGVFSANGGVAESEVWTDATVLQGAYKRGDSFQSVSARLVSPAAFQSFKDSLTTNPQLNVKVLRQSDYYAEQSETLTRLITTLGVLIAGLMAVGAVFGALNTMYSAVAARTREIATLRALGFGSGAVVIALMIESLLVAVSGGAVGAGLAYAGFNNFHAATMNWQSFSQVTFAFAVTPQLLVQGIVLAAAIGMVGGLLPAIRAARQPIATALREL
jgi:putative ABC transport system permease protein